METQTRKSKLKIETQNRNSKSKLENKTQNRNSKLENLNSKSKGKNGNSKSKSKLESKLKVKTRNLKPTLTSFDFELRFPNLLRPFKKHFRCGAKNSVERIKPLCLINIVYLNDFWVTSKNGWLFSKKNIFIFLLKQRKTKHTKNYYNILD